MAHEIAHSGSMDEMDVVERQLRLASHGSTMMGEFVMKDLEGNVLNVSSITLDHSTVGKALNYEAGPAVSEDALYKDLDEEQQRIYDELVAAGVLLSRKP